MPKCSSVAGAAAVVLLAGLAACGEDESAPAAASSAGTQAVAATAAPTAAPAAGKNRTYYVAADPVTWDYAPAGRNRITGEDFTEDEEVFVGAGPDRNGSKYAKCIYRGYTDDTFKTVQERPEADRYLGNLGPVLRAEVGDTMTVVFKNNCTIDTSIHSHGVKYDKAGEGAAYDDGTSGADKADDAVKPGSTYTYKWEVPERAGPGPMEGSSAVWMYHSHNDEIGDVYAGLSGFIVVTAKGRAKADGSPADIDRELFALFEVDDENASPLFETNLKALSDPPEDTDDEEFVESNLMHAVNGYLYGNGPVATMKRGERVRWYVMGMGTEVDLHTPHWHGNTVTSNGMRTDVVNLLPASMLTADMTPDAVGTWLFHCHVADHIAAGMQAKYQVTG
jgi:manganese oxidase